jgi:hypothetical protein
VGSGAGAGAGAGSGSGSGAGPAARILSLNRNATNGATCATRREAGLPVLTAGPVAYLLPALPHRMQSGANLQLGIDASRDRLARAAITRAAMRPQWPGYSVRGAIAG